MKIQLIAAAALAAAVWTSAGTLEQSVMDAQGRFEAAQARPRPLKAGFAPVAGRAVDKGPGITVEHPALVPGKAGAPLGSFAMAERLDLQRDMLVKQLGTKTYDIGIAGDSEFKILYFTARREGVLALKRVNKIEDLRGSGVDMTVEPGVVYNVRVKIDILNPVRNSTLFITATQGTQGPSHSLKTGELLDRLKAKSYLFKIGRTEYATLYTTDVDTSTDQLAGTRSIVFVNESGVNSKAWHVAEAALAVGQPTSVALGSNSVTVIKTADGRIELYESGK